MAEGGEEGIDGFGGALSLDVNASIGLIPHQAGDGVSAGDGASGGAEADTLDPAFECNGSAFDGRLSSR